MDYLSHKRISTVLEQELQDAGVHSDPLKQKAHALIEVMIHPSERVPLRDNDLDDTSVLVIARILIQIIRDTIEEVVTKVVINDRTQAETTQNLELLKTRLELHKERVAKIKESKLPRSSSIAIHSTSTAFALTKTLDLLRSYFGEDVSRKEIRDKIDQIESNIETNRGDLISKESPVHTLDSLSESPTVEPISREKNPNANPYLILDFFEFAILSTLMVAFFPWSLLFCLFYYGMEDTKLIVAALIHDAVKTALAVLSGIVCLGLLGLILWFVLANQ